MELSAPKTILLVDPNPQDIASLAEDLERAGFSVKQASNVHTAFSLFCSESFSVVVSDAYMGDGSGIEFLARIKAFAAEQPVILLVDLDYKLSSQQLVDMGASMALTRPATSEQVIQALTQTLARVLDQWGARAPRLTIELSIDIEFLPSGNQVSSRAINIGIGGLFVELPPQQIPQDRTLLSFEMQMTKPHFTEIRGEAIVRWARRKKSDLPTGIGLEFILLSDEHRDKVIEVTDSLKRTFAAALPKY